jgi:hypothetical protein
MNQFSILNSQSLHPGFQFCGEPPNAFLETPDDLLNYVLSSLQGVPVLPPEVSLKQWSELFVLLTPHWILPLLYWQTAALPPECRPPEEVTEYLRSVFLRTRVRTMLLEHQLSQVLTGFKRENVRILLLKGPALARSVYPNPVLRQGSDIDLLVLPEQMAQARMILENMGYACQEKRFEISKDYYCEEKFFPQKHPGDRCMIELHWDLHRFSGIARDVGIADLFANAVKIKSPPLVFEALNPVDALIHRSLNNAFIHDRDMRLSWIYDAVFLARSLSPEDWRILQERSVAWRARLAVEHSLRLAQIWGGLQLPPAHADFSRWPRPAKIETEAWDNAVHRHESLPDYLRLHMSDSSRLPDKIRFFIHLLFPSPDYMRMKYPPPREGLLFLSYLRRWGHWVRKLI